MKKEKKTTRAMRTLGSVCSLFLGIAALLGSTWLVVKLFSALKSALELCMTS